MLARPICKDLYPDFPVRKCLFVPKHCRSPKPALLPREDRTLKGIRLIHQRGNKGRWSTIFTQLSKKLLRLLVDRLDGSNWIFAQ